MTQNILEDLVRTDDGVLRVSAATKLGISAPTIYAFARSRGLQKMSKGIYADANGWHDEMWLTSLRWPRAVFLITPHCLLTPLLTVNLAQ